MEFADIIKPTKAGIRDPQVGCRGKHELDDFFIVGENAQWRKLDLELEVTNRKFGEHVRYI